MPVTADRASVASYAQFPAELDRDWLGRVCHLSGADLAVIRRRADPVTQLGYATQLVTVRAIGTFQSGPSAPPEPVVAAVAHQLGIDDPGVLAGYRDIPVRWRHTAEIRDRYGYRDFSAQPDRFAFTVWLYRQAWADEVASSVLFRAAHRQLAGPADPAAWPQRAGCGWSPRCGNAPSAGSTAGWRERPARSCGPSWTSSCWCPRGSAARSWTCCGARRSRPRSPDWCVHWTAWSEFGPWEPASWTCRGYRPPDWWPWPVTPTRPGSPSWPIWDRSGGSPRLSPTPTCWPPAPATM